MDGAKTNGCTGATVTPVPVAGAGVAARTSAGRSDSQRSMGISPAGAFRLAAYSASAPDTMRPWSAPSRNAPTRERRPQLDTLPQLGVDLGHARVHRPLRDQRRTQLGFLLLGGRRQGRQFAGLVGAPLFGLGVENRVDARVFESAS